MHNDKAVLFPMRRSLPTCPCALMRVLTITNHPRTQRVNFGQQGKLTKDVRVFIGPKAFIPSVRLVEDRSARQPKRRDATAAVERNKRSFGLALGKKPWQPEPTGGPTDPRRCRQRIAGNVHAIEARQNDSDIIVAF